MFVVIVLFLNCDVVFNFRHYEQLFIIMGKSLRYHYKNSRTFDINELNLTHRNHDSYQILLNEKVMTDFKCESQFLYQDQKMST